MAKSNYKIAVGWNMQAGVLALDPQPRSPGVKATRRTYAASGAVYDEGLYVELLWSAIDDELVYVNILTHFGLHNNNLFSKVTVSARNDLFDYRFYNGIAMRPIIDEDVEWNYMPQNMRILIKDLVPPPF